MFSPACRKIILIWSFEDLISLLFIPDKRLLLTEDDSVFLIHLIVHCD